MALAGVGLQTLVFEPDALTTRPLPCADVDQTDGKREIRLNCKINRS